MTIQTNMYWIGLL